MSGSEPLISVVIPAYNYAKTLTRAAQSVLMQLEPHAELIIIDDGSTDETPAVMAALCEANSGRLRGLRQSNAGLAAVRNRGIEEARGTYLVFLDADDELVEGALALLAQHLAAHPDTRMVIGGHYSMHADGRETLHLPGALAESGLERVRDYLLNKALSISNGACTMHRQVFERGRYPQHFRNAEDIPVFAQVLAGYACSVLDKPLARIHKHDDSLRHNVEYGMQIGIQLVDEVFETGRLPEAFQVLKRPFTAQRYLSLFRSFSAAGRRGEALEFYRLAVRTDWRALLRWSYTGKALRAWLRAGR